MNQQQALQIGWKRISGSDCFVEPDGTAHLVIIKKPKSSEKMRETAKKYASNNKNKVKQSKKKRLEKSPDEIKEYNDQYNEKHYDCVRRAKRLQNKAYYHRNPSKIIELNKKIVDKKIEKGYAKTCASGHHNRCKNTKSNCVCKCHNT